MYLESLAQSRAPLRAKRCNKPASIRIANNRATWAPRPGVYRIQAVASDTATGHQVYFDVSKSNDVLSSFPLAVTVLDVRGELLPVAYWYESPMGTGTLRYAPGYAVEIEVREDEVVHFWDPVDESRIKAVMVDELNTLESGGTETELARR